MPEIFVRLTALQRLRPCKKEANVPDLLFLGCLFNTVSNALYLHQSTAFCSRVSLPHDCGHSADATPEK